MIIHSAPAPGWHSVGVEARGGEYDVRRNLMSMNELLRNSIAGDQSGIQLLPGVGVASAESAVISRSLLLVTDRAVQIRH